MPRVSLNGVPQGGSASVAAGDITDAGAVGEAIVQAETAAEASAALVPSARTAVADTGWTDVVTGTASAAHASGVHTLSVNASGVVLAHRAASGVVAEAPELELVGRILVTSGAPGSTWWTVLSLGNSADTNAAIAQVKETGQVQLWTVVAAGATNHFTSAGSISLTSGEDWVRLVVRPAYVAAYYGTGSGSTPPMSWTFVGAVTTPPALVGGGLLTRVGLRAGRNGSGSGSYVTEWRGVATRPLGLTP
jgi:hypothetical protein